MVVATITVIGIVAFRFLDAQDNTQIAKEQTATPQTSQVATVETAEDVETVATELESAEAELDSLDAELETEFAF
jgi:uncharacterized membrane-anchored protein YhcB (DUF1043 family)